MNNIDAVINMSSACAPSAGAVTRLSVGSETRLVRVRSVEWATRGRVRVGVEFLDADRPELPPLKVAA